MNFPRFTKMWDEPKNSPKVPTKNSPDHLFNEASCFDLLRAHRSDDEPRLVLLPVFCA